MIYYEMHLSPSFAFRMPHQSHCRFFHNFLERSIYIYWRVMPVSHSILNNLGERCIYMSSMLVYIISKLVQSFFYFGIGVSLSISMVEHSPHFLHLVAMLEWNFNEHLYSNSNWMVVYSYHLGQMKNIWNIRVRIYIVYMEIYIDNCYSK